MEERAVKPKMTTKAERRALQEKQRAAKAAKMTGEQGSGGAASLLGGKPGQANAPTPPSATQVVNCIAAQAVLHIITITIYVDISGPGEHVCREEVMSLVL